MRIKTAVMQHFIGNLQPVIQRGESVCVCVRARTRVLKSLLSVKQLDRPDNWTIPDTLTHAHHTRHKCKLTGNLLCVSRKRRKL